MFSFCSSELLWLMCRQRPEDNLITSGSNIHSGLWKLINMLIVILWHKCLNGIKTLWADVDVNCILTVWCRNTSGWLDFYVLMSHKYYFLKLNLFSKRTKPSHEKCSKYVCNHRRIFVYSLVVLKLSSLLYHLCLYPCGCCAECRLLTAWQDFHFCRGVRCFTQQWMSKA